MIANRIGRLEFLFWCGVPIVAGAILLTIVAFMVGVKDTDIGGVGSSLHGLLALMLLAASVVILKAEVSRFHDLGWAGWAILLMFIPLVDILVFLFLLLAPGQKTRNLYGEPPIFLQRLRKVA
jgi:uncharacterized membrane protein YhaH (DUF805 family)